MKEKSIVYDICLINDSSSQRFIINPGKRIEISFKVSINRKVKIQSTLEIAKKIEISQRSISNFLQNNENRRVKPT